MNTKIKEFFECSDLFDYMVTRQLSHIRENWELTWDNDKRTYKPEEESYAEIINDLIAEVSSIEPPEKYHNNEDCLAEYCKQRLGWDIEKVGNRWLGFDYVSILEQAGFDDKDEENLILAACGRVKAAINRGQLHFDEMEEFHRKMFANVLAIILYHRDNI